MTKIMKDQRNFLRLGIAGTMVVMAALAVALLSGSGWVRAAGGGNPASYWHIGYYTPSSQTLSFAAASTPVSGIASLNFTNQPNTALLVTNNKGQFPNLLGDLTGKSVTATFIVSGLNTSTFFIYGGEPSCSSTTSYVRYYFETSNAGGFDETHYWWSNPAHYNFTANDSVNLGAVSLTGDNWSDYFGHFGTGAYSAGFNAAVSNVTEIGLSFGGGCFFENGVGTSDGSGTFTLNSYTVS